jgi:hypothetical protein
MEKKILEILEEMAREIEGLVFVEDCEDEVWSGSCLVYSFKRAIPKNISYCYLGKDSCCFISSGEKMELEYDFVKIWRLPFDFMEVIDFYEVIKTVVGEKLQEKLQKIVTLKTQEIKNEISILEHEISRNPF